ncbi:uncharacterized protein NP_3398A [Natronomonas pharaonis DSM 2160]|uniref:Uncharacterized protein n=1 Tax=Natronomonas pharaonis (strain ATCC 35678 / DSM 2160 / CIP 103997 / JCM 8858 / NBRC 14720 / NCIMB 2260 / Gabara) TaxID=348780 RepID=A0A1U7EXA2_NATPD|nr:hypothetical protein [Natronomonas pharaonis]CAI49790.1 uncharacterized protein NP_3398A [Natronomonas pharaonis DSM 2160]
MAERELEAERERPTVVQLDDDRERDLLAGAVTEAEGTTADEDALEKFAEQLAGYRKNAERQEAWIRTLRLPRDGKPDPGEEIEIEFLLPSGDTFTRSFVVPPQVWPADNDLVRLLDAVGRTPATLTDLLGDAVPVTHDGDEWTLDIDPEPTGERANGGWSERQTTTLLIGTLVPLVVVAQVLSPIAMFVGGASLITPLLYLLGGMGLVATLGYMVTSVVQRADADLTHG